MKKKKNKNKKNQGTPFDKELSLELDRATIALEDATKKGDAIRMLYASEWKRCVERQVWGNQK